MERFVAWLAELSPLLGYLVVGVATFLENIFPPTPSDVVTALGGFATGLNHSAPGLVWLAAWLANMGGTVVVYLAARRYGRRFLGSPTGRRLLPPDAVVGMEREYLRFGLAGIFLSRFLPGFRSFVAPFVGLVGLPPLPAFLVMGMASAIWYAVMVWVGVRVGAHWEAIRTFLGTLNRTLALVALGVTGILGWWLWRQRRGSLRRRRRLLDLISRAMGDPVTGEPVSLETGDLHARAAAALLFELTHADPGFSLGERQAIGDFLREHWDAGPVPRRSSSTSQSIIADTTELATIVSHQFEIERRISLAERLYRIALNDGNLSRHEERLMVRIGDLLGLTPVDLAEARRRAQP